MLETYRKLLDLITPRERRRAYLLFGMILTMGLMETAGVASILPFLAVLANPGLIESNRYLAFVYDSLGFESARSFLVFLGAVVFVIVVFGLAFKMLTSYALERFQSMCTYSLSSRMLQHYLHQPYSWFLNRNSADLGAELLSEVDTVVSHSLGPAMALLARAIVVACLIALLVAVQPLAAAMVAGVLGGCYVLIYFGVRQILTRLGGERRQVNKKRFQIAMEALGGIKDVKLIGLEDPYLHRYQVAARRLARAGALSAVIGEMPRNVLEAVAFGGMLLLILFLLTTGDGTLGSILPILGVYAFAGLRLFPALQQLYTMMTSLRYTRPALDALHRDLIETRAGSQDWRPAWKGEPMRLRRRLELADVHYAYPQADRSAARGLSLAIAANTTVGIVGGTGAGKTTAVDLMLGLLEPQQGELRVDGRAVTRDSMRAWQRSVGYVPQQIFLTDDTVLANIAFGVPEAEVDRAAAERAARIAELNDFVVSELPEGYDTFIGERGVRLSGGQRQRIGIARALYNDPDVLIMDEATSALDNLTERAVMDAVHNLGNAKTVVLIAHRLTTVRECDIIYMLEQGRVIAAGTYDELLGSSQKFRAMAGAQG